MINNTASRFPSGSKKLLVPHSFFSNGVLYCDHLQQCVRSRLVHRAKGNLCQDLYLMLDAINSFR
jgi:hypothetical protein